MHLQSTLISTAAALFAGALVDNGAPRIDTAGNIVNAHQGSLSFFEHAGQAGLWLWAGSAFVPCAHEDPLNGCANMSYGACGFDDNPISIYASADLANGGWQLLSADVLGPGRAVGELWEPNLVWHAATQRFVLWYIYSKPNTTLGVVQVATSPSPWLVGGGGGGGGGGGSFNFSIANHNVSLRYPSFTSAEVFLDGASGGRDAYVLYSSQIGGRTPAVVEKLDARWTGVTGVDVSPPFGPSDEGEVMFERAGVFYMLEGGHCCFCRGGTDLAVYASRTGPMGPYELQGSVNPLFAVHPYGNATKTWHEYTLPCQQAHVAALPYAKDEHGEAQLVWVGDGWQQAQDGRKDHDPQFWVPLRFDAEGKILNMTRVMNWTAVN